MPELIQGPRERELESEAVEEYLALVEKYLGEGFKERDSVYGASLLYCSDRHEKRLVFADEGQVSDVSVSWSLTSVGDAFDWLRPNEVPQDSARQGDLFFVQHYESDKHASIPRMLKAAAKSRDDVFRDWIQKGRSDYSYTVQYETGAQIGDTNHVAEEVATLHKGGNVAFIPRPGNVKHHRFQANPRVFVRGAVTHGEHAPVLLEDWVEVLPNKVSGLGIGPLPQPID